MLSQKARKYYVNENSSHSIGNRTRDLLVCSAVSQPTAPRHSLTSDQTNLRHNLTSDQTNLRHNLTDQTNLRHNLTDQKNLRHNLTSDQFYPFKAYWLRDAPPV
jgi:hypothetical protein